MVLILAPADQPDSEVLSRRHLPPAPPAHFFHFNDQYAVLPNAPLKPMYANELSRAMHKAQADARGSDEGGLLAAEVAAGRAIDSRVSEEQAKHFAEIYRQAQVDFFRAIHNPERRKTADVLLATTSRVVDYKVEGNAVAALYSELKREGRESELLAAIDKGYANVFPTRVQDGDIQDPVHLVSEVIRWSAENGPQKHRLRATAPLRAWMKEVLLASGVALNPRLGGISAVDTLQGAALGDRTTMMALGSVPDDVRQFLRPETKVIGDRADWKKLQDIPSEGKSVGHLCLFQNHGESILPRGIAELSINGTPVARAALSKLDILITGLSTVVGFGDLPLDRIREAGLEHDLVVLTGAQNLKTSEDVRKYFSGVDALGSVGTPIAFCYSEPKHKGIEMEIWKEFRRGNAVQFVGLNTGEASELLERMYHATTKNNPLELDPPTIARMENALSLLADKSTPFGPGCETPQWLFRCASVLQEIFKVPAVRVRGRESDVLMLSAEIEPENAAQLQKSLILSRHLGTLKVATPEGLITEQRKLAYLRSPPVGRALAALHGVADEARALAGADGDAATLASRSYLNLADGRKCFAVPPLPFFVRDGGTQSAGDTMDYFFASREVWNLLHRSRRIA